MHKETFNHIEIKLPDTTAWKKHEEMWINILSSSYMPSDLEKYLIPINDDDILISAYFKLYNIQEKTFID